MAAGLDDIRGVRAAQRIFAGIADAYDGPAQVFGLFRQRAWHRALVEAIARDRPRRVLDMCTGTGAVAAEIVKRTSAHVVGADATRAMLDRARLRFRSAERRVDLVRADAQAPPFGDASFDALVWSYLLRYVDDVPETVRALGRLVRPGGAMASLEFGVPQGRAARAAWEVYTRAILPAGLALLSRGWRHVGGFLGESIRAFDEQWPVEALEDLWRSAGFEDVKTRRLSFGGGVVTSGRRKR
jgi:demethylmenaquinone methyltransferase/2-methoxy-6-polyprenyl-1,4-benzoquinol methylase